MSGRPRVLVIDDNPNDIELLTMALEENGVGAEVAALMDGRAALAELRRLATVPPSTWPDLIVLDLNMPIANGHEVLAHAAGDARLRGLRIAVLTTSTSPDDERRCAAHGAAAYLVKPRRFTGFAPIVQRLRALLEAERPA